MIPRILIRHAIILWRFFYVQNLKSWIEWTWYHISPTISIYKFTIIRWYLLLCVFFQSGDRVTVAGKAGRILFLGETKFAGGQWAGVVLDKAEGKNDGSVQGVRYFQVSILLFYNLTFLHLPWIELEVWDPRAGVNKVTILPHLFMSLKSVSPYFITRNNTFSLFRYWFFLIFVTGGTNYMIFPMFDRFWTNFWHGKHISAI